MTKQFITSNKSLLNAGYHLGNTHAFEVQFITSNKSLLDAGYHLSMDTIKCLSSSIPKYDSIDNTKKSIHFFKDAFLTEVNLTF